MVAMKVIVTATGTSNRNAGLEWPEGWPIPHVDDEVSIPGYPEVTHVRVVEWNPSGDEEHPEPFVYLVVGPRRGSH